jgi:hypothetical protein
MFRLTGMAAAIAALAVAAPSAFAASLPAADSGTISVFVPSSGGSHASSQPTYEGNVAFNTSNTKGLKNPRVSVICYQNGNVVWGTAGGPAMVFTLGGDSSQWVQNGGGPATCTADLFYILNANGTGEWNGHGAQGGFVSLAQTTFASV